MTKRARSFSLAAEGDPAVKQMYLPNTNVLITQFLHDAGMGEVTDFMSVGREAGGETEQSSRQLVRVAKAIRTPIPFRMVCRPAFDYAQEPHEIEMGPDGCNALFHTPNQKFVLKSTHPLHREHCVALRVKISGRIWVIGVSAPAVVTRIYL